MTKDEIREFVRATIAIDSLSSQEVIDEQVKEITDKWLTDLDYSRQWIVVVQLAEPISGLACQPTWAYGPIHGSNLDSFVAMVHGTAKYELVDVYTLNSPSIYGSEFAISS